MHRVALVLADPLLIYVRMSRLRLSPLYLSICVFAPSSESRFKLDTYWCIAYNARVAYYPKPAHFDVSVAA